MSDYPTPALEAGHKSDAIFALREMEFSRLDRDNHTYLDYTGGMVYPESLVRAHAELLIHNTYGNPHSNNPTSLAATALCEKARSDVLKFFNADPEEYVCIFTPNASGALRIVGESFPFTSDSNFVLLTDNHNSVNGIREFAKSRGAGVHYAKTTSELRIDDDLLVKILEKKKPATKKKKNIFSLFAYPAQSNFSGVKHSLDWIERAQKLGWRVLLDAAAYVPTSPLDLGVHKPDFVSMSFYKIFGYPTGVGALVMRKEMILQLQRPWFAGGTIKFVSTSNSERHLMAVDHEAFEDGTINYLALPAVSMGLDFMNRIEGGMIGVRSHIQALTSDLIQKLLALRHKPSGNPIVRLLGPQNIVERGGTVAMDVFDKEGLLVDPSLVESLANDAGISIRSGCFCNPGDSEMSFPEAWSEIRQVLADTGDAIKAREHGLHVAAAIRISVGIATSEQDIDKLVSFLSGQFYNCVASEANSRRGSLAGLSLSAIPTTQPTTPPPSGDDEVDSYKGGDGALDDTVQVVSDQSLRTSPTTPNPTATSSSPSTPLSTTNKTSSHRACCVVM